MIDSLIIGLSILIYIMIGIKLFDYGFGLIKKSRPYLMLTDSQYNAVMLIFSIFWLPLFFVALINSIFKGVSK